MTAEITAAEVASRFVAGEAGLEGLTRLGDAELAMLLAGRELRHLSGSPHLRQEFFSQIGIVTRFSGYRRMRRRYIIVGDALCVEQRRGGWRCRRFYRSSTGDLFQVMDGERNLALAVVVREAQGRLPKSGRAPR